ncbi:NADP-dependent 3-hydroxy acid dehydrogenase YdfG [Chitinophaga sp. CF118]|uniref:SDR family NAD(P)-dependent oxidoreductase n=1 Tax=Chitinophaga sp. CF118 TaxID=1884367 RepID=UPI0008E1707B|nr:SDR family NAD(P)-dependent oxidoreductase [Chitinophaga sp. CF118]SFD59649.1 NADP-dependent 3-hydroxy acid dehydrogenase YdfG [Chitinophaga sp. CF118]
MNNSNKTAVVTGISSGIGLALTKKLLEENYNVFGTTRSGELNTLVHPNLEVVALEVTDPLSIQRAVSKIKALANGIDLLVNNAGAAPDVFEVKPEYEAFTQTLDTNITGVVFFTEPLLNYINTGGQVIFISSNMGLPKNAAANGPGYRMSKAAINMYAAMLATRLADQHIRVTPMHPGWVQTRLGGDQAPLTPGQAADGLYQGITSNSESGKFWNITVPGIEAY